MLVARPNSEKHANRSSMLTLPFANISAQTENGAKIKTKTTETRETQNVDENLFLKSI